MFVAFCLSVFLFVVVYQYNMLLFWLMGMLLFVYQYICCCVPVLYYVVVLAYEYVCCLFCLPVDVFCYFCLPINFAITERESHHVMVVSENETWIWRGRIVTMPLPSGF